MATAKMRRNRAKQRAGFGVRAIARDFKRLSAGQKPIGSRTGRGFNTRGAGTRAGSDS